MNQIKLCLLTMTLCGCATGTAAERRDLAIQAALDSARAACLILQSDKSIERAPGVDAWCDGVLNGCAAK